MEEKSHSFKQLNAYIKAKELVIDIYGVIKMFP